MPIPRLTWSTEPSMPDQIAGALDEAGCCVIEQAADVDLMQAIHGELATFDAVGSVGASAFEGYTTRRTGAPLPRSASFRSIAMHPERFAHTDNEPAEMPAGSLLWSTGRIYHGGKANTTDRWRCGLSLQHVVRLIRRHLGLYRMSNQTPS